MSVNPKVAIIIVNWNKRDDAINLLTSLKNINYDNHDIILVDNASTDDSVKTIRKQFPDIELVENPENLGGTGGFNSGMRHALRNKDYQYLWLLDNDAEVEENTLIELTRAMERDEKIGLAGSRIVDSLSRDITVEAGAFFRLDTVGVTPLFRNIRNLKIKSEVTEVDYVAICSALVRTSALERVDLMDERYFIFWDDMDWGLQFKNNGYKVVSVLNSVVYHPAFTEKRGVIVDAYYGVRNPLLTYTKHFSPMKRSLIFYRYLRQKCTVLVLLGLSGKINTMRLGFDGIFDFIAGRWGKQTNNIQPDESNGESTELPGRINDVLILNDGSKDEIYDALKSLVKTHSNANYTLLITDDRADFFDQSFKNIIKVDTTKSYSLIYLLSIFLTIIKKNYDVAINFKHTSPFSYAVKKVYSYDSSKKEFQETDNNMKNIWKPIVSTIFGEVTSILLLPIIWIRSLRYVKTG